MTRRLGRLAARLVPWLLLAFLLLGPTGCDTTGPRREPPYIAIVAIISAPPGTDVGTQYTYQVTEISGTLGIDKTLRRAPTDTVIVPVQPATYRVSLRGLPPQCLVQDGTDYLLLVPEGSNTAIVRYLISCQSQITITTATDGFAVDQGFIYRIGGPAGEIDGIMGPNDTTRFDRLAAGDYTVELTHVAPNCVVTSDGGRLRRFAITGAGGQVADYRVVCSDEARRPTLLGFAGTYHDGTSGFVFRATDPDHDIERYYWDLTDCRGKSILAAGGRLRRGLSSDRTAGEDTVTVYGAIEIGLPDSAVAGGCTSVRVADEYGNTTPVAEVPIHPGRPGPAAGLFNAKFVNTATLQTTLQVNDPAFTGVFVAALLRDGILFPPDGSPDLGVYNTVGYTDVLVPNVPLGNGRPLYYDYYAVIVYLFDAQGNFRRLEDDDLFH